MEREPSCESEVVHQLMELRAKAADYVRHDGRATWDDLFFVFDDTR